MPYPRELTPREQLNIANQLASLALDANVSPSDILAELEIPRVRFNLAQAPAVVWREILQGVHAGMSKTATSGCDAVAVLLQIMASNNYLPGKIELLDIAFDLARSRRVPSAPAPATGPAQQLFLSYSHSDRADVDRLYDAMSGLQRNLQVFQDHRMPAGTRWYDAIFDAATSVSKMVCWTTDAYLKSTFCAFEIGLVTTASTGLVPVFVPPDLKTRPLPAYLSSFQGIDGTPPVDITRIVQGIIQMLK